AYRMIIASAAAAARRWGLCLAVLAASNSIAAAQDTELHRRGRVTDDAGQPIGAARVSAGDASPQVLTGPDGRYEIRLPASARVLSFSAPGFITRRVELMASQRSAIRNVVLERAAEELPAVSITGRTTDELASVPGATMVVGPAVLRERAPLSTMDALRTVPGLQTADEDPYGLNLNIGFRGMPPRRSSRTLLLEDGMPILLGPYGDPSMHYGPPVEAVEHVEVIKGSGQVMNGPQTSGGVVNFVTRQPTSDGRVAIATIGGGEVGYRNARTFLGAGSDGRGASLDFTYREGGGVRREHAHRAGNLVLKGLLPVGGTRLLLKASAWDES